ncbi:ABC-type glycerol-3-phosphate transport system, substrate-binding protein [Caloramator fervidus]|uniref:ABC-type glycerol-3-phosphate transport system, substrate-binding protein n=1 Tax=Caloramator fervidus TaxID=29344 RepID=A0A1H5XK85_9CLOT|nr:extracellular solute-binding protein [Caloramator fervidus]SEG12194.1 ABC-type glycerol-3-phosphate transport system, substrate-binding protein [Caloramator fervidus]
MKKVVSILLMFILLLNFSSCQKIGSKEKEQKKLKIAIMYPEESIGGIYKEIVKKYEANNPDVKVELILDFSDETKIKEALTKEGEYDIIALKRNQLIEYAKTGLIQDITDFVDRNGLRDKLYPINISYGTFNGKVYGIGDLPITYEWFYNKSLFNKYGIKEPTSLKEFIDISKKFKNVGIIPISVGAMDRWTLVLLFGNITCQTTGIQSFTDNLGSDKKAFENIEGIDEAFNIFEKITKTSIDKNCVDINFMQSVDDFIKGKAAILPSISITKQLIDSKKTAGFEYGVFEYPIIFKDNPISKLSASGGQILALSSKTSNREAAEKFLSFLFSEQAQKLFVEKGYISALKFVNQPDTIIDRTIISHIEMTDDNSGMLIDNVDLKMADAIGIVLSDIIEGRVKAKEAWERVLKISFQQ